MIRVTNIERFATHDGPGIRTTVFLKGCPLHCPWCANPETQRMKPQCLYTKEKCILCHDCENVCKTKAITFKNGSFHYDEQACSSCFACEDACLQDAIEFHGKDQSISQILEEVMKDKAYYDRSNGGLTLSGGEPFLQYDAFLNLLRKAKEKGLHIAVETTGNYTLERLQLAMPYIDLFLYDFKHLDNQVLFETIGANGAQIKENLKYLLKVDPQRVEVRIPVIPGFNYDQATLTVMLTYLSGIGVQRVALLPYHSLGKAKYEKMGWSYDLPVTMLQKEDLHLYQGIAEQLGMYVTIGG